MILAILLAAIPASTASSPAMSPDGLWRDLPSPSRPSAGEEWVAPSRYRAVWLDPAASSVRLRELPAGAASGSGRFFYLPRRGEGFERFRIEPYVVMHPELAARYPNLLTFQGWSLERPGTRAFLDLTPQSFHAMVLAPDGATFIDPLTRDRHQAYAVYAPEDLQLASAVGWSCGAVASEAGRELVPSWREGVARASRGVVPGEESRTYRLAMATTGEYTAFHGGTVAAGMAAVVTALTRINGIFESELAIRMELIPNNDSLIFTDGASDPYSNGDRMAMLNENQAYLDLVIQTPNYDLGHVLATGNGGSASIGAPCDAPRKGRGTSGLNNPTGDAFHVGVLAHELGHQWGATHTFNGTAGGCSPTTRRAATAYEPGSGSTILSYAGTCGSQNIQTAKDPYFHAASLDQIFAYAHLGVGATCGTATATGSLPPTVTPPAPFTLPIDTPFQLCGGARDPDGDPLTYVWEQFDLGPAGPPNSPTGNAPLFRSFSPEPSPLRTFPRWSDLLAGTIPLGELLPTYARDLRLRLTAREQRSGGAGFGSATVTLPVTGESGPLEILEPNAGTTSWTGGGQAVVEWSPAGIHQPPVSCQTLSVYLSVDGGQSLTHTLAQRRSTAVGTATVDIPAGAGTGAARVLVACDGSGVFAVSESFVIASTTDGGVSGESVGSPLFAGNFERCDLGAWSAAVGLP